MNGTLTGNGVVAGVATDNAILTVGPLQVTGTAGFALTVSTVDADTDGNGTADLMGATLMGLALDVTNAGVTITDVASLTVSGKLAIAKLAPAVATDLRSWFGLKMGDAGHGRSGPVAGHRAVGDDDDDAAGLQQRDQRSGGDQAAGLGERVRSGWRRAVR